jgi:uncharacterized OsmC-like protein
MNEMGSEVTRTSAPAPSVDRPVGDVRVGLEHLSGFEFRVRFDDTSWTELVVDEPPPLGRSRGPNPARLLAASIGNCLAASLLFCFHRAGLDVLGLEADVKVDLVRNARHRLRVGSVAVHLRPHLNADEEEIAACLEDFEDFCIVTQSVREGMTIDVDVKPVCDDLYGCEG